MSRSRPGIRRGAVDRVWNVYPDPRVIHLGDRALTVEDAGPDRGFPVLVHCGGGSRHLSPAAVREARLHGFRLISYDRPGYGGSTPMPDRVIADCCADVEASWAASESAGSRCGDSPAAALMPWPPQRCCRMLSRPCACSPPSGLTARQGWTSWTGWPTPTGRRSVSFSVIGQRRGRSSGP